MTTNFKLSPSGALDICASSYHDALSSATAVSLIQTDVSNLLTCSLTDKIEDVKSRAELADFDNIPVVDNNNAIVGTFKKRNSASLSFIQDDYEKLHPDMLIASSAPIFDFIDRAENQHCCYIVSRSGISGMVTISDLQKLPVQLALFGLIIQFEHLVGKKLRECLKDAEALFISVLEHLEPNEKTRAEGMKRNSKTPDLFVDWITPLFLVSKLKVLKKLNFQAIRDWNVTDSINKLRNDIAHGNGYAQTSELVNKLVSTQRHLFESIAMLQK